MGYHEKLMEVGLYWLCIIRRKFITHHLVLQEKASFLSVPFYAYSTEMKQRLTGWLAVSHPSTLFSLWSPLKPVSMEFLVIHFAPISTAMLQNCLTLCRDKNSFNTAIWSVLGSILYKMIASSLLILWVLNSR